MTKQSLLVRVGAGAAAIVSVAAVLGLLGISVPRLATGTDIERLDRQQTKTAIEVYGQKVRALILQAPGPNADPVQRRLWEMELESAKRQLQQAEDQAIRLSQ